MTIRSLIMFLFLFQVFQSFGQNDFEIEVNINSCLTPVVASNINLDYQNVYITGLEWNQYPITPQIEIGLAKKIANKYFKITFGVRRIQLPFKLFPYISTSIYNNEIKYETSVYNADLKIRALRHNKKLSYFTGLSVDFGYFNDLKSSFIEGELFIEEQIEPIKYQLAISYGRSLNLLWSNQLKYNLITNSNFEIDFNTEFSYGITHMLTAVGLYQINDNVTATNISMTRGTNLLLGLSFKFSKPTKNK